jgi:hypothetical protein
MILAEFVAKLQQYPQHMIINLHGSDFYNVKIYGKLPEMERRIELLECYEPYEDEEPIRWADVKSFKPWWQS